MAASSYEKDGGTVFLETTPPHWAARGLAYILILLFTAAIIASVLVQVPETVSSPFVLVPIRGTDPVKVLRGGVVAQLLTTEGQAIGKGDPIAIIKSDTVGERSADLQSFQTETRGGGESLSLAKRKYESQRLSDEKEALKLGDRINHLMRMIELKNKQLALARQMADSYAKLQKDGLASTTETTRRQLDVTEIASELEQLESSQRETQAAIEKLKHETAARESEYRELERGLKEEIEKDNIRITALKDGLAQSLRDEVTITAPCSGTVLKLQVKSPGAVVQEGEVLCEVACAGEQLQAELTVPQSGIGRIRPGQGVKLLYDAFPYQRYGAKFGALRWISPATSSTNFRVLVDIADEAVIIKGQLRPLMSGMGGRAEVVVGKRSLISYAFEPIRQLRENLAEPPAEN